MLSKMEGPMFNSQEQRGQIWDFKVGGGVLLEFVLCIILCSFGFS